MVEVDAPTIRPWTPGPPAGARGGRHDRCVAGRPDGGRGRARGAALRRGARARRTDRERAQPSPVGSLARSAAGAARSLPGPRPADAATSRSARTASPRCGTADGPESSGPRERRADLRFQPVALRRRSRLYAVTAGREVGVDIERARERYTAEFLRAWVAHEAAGKCRGTGLGRGSGSQRHWKDPPRVICGRRSWMSVPMRRPPSRSRAGRASCGAGSGAQT